MFTKKLIGWLVRGQFDLLFGNCLARWHVELQIGNSSDFNISLRLFHVVSSTNRLGFLWITFIGMYVVVL